MEDAAAAAVFQQHATAKETARAFSEACRARDAVLKEKEQTLLGAMEAALGDVSAVALNVGHEGILYNKECRREKTLNEERIGQALDHLRTHPSILKQCLTDAGKTAGPDGPSLAVVVRLAFTRVLNELFVTTTVRPCVVKRMPKQLREAAVAPMPAPPQVAKLVHEYNVARARRSAIRKHKSQGLANCREVEEESAVAIQTYLDQQATGAAETVVRFVPAEAPPSTAEEAGTAGEAEAQGGKRPAPAPVSASAADDVEHLPDIPQLRPHHAVSAQPPKKAKVIHVPVPALETPTTVRYRQKPVTQKARSVRITPFTQSLDPVIQSVVGTITATSKSVAAVLKAATLETLANAIMDYYVEQSTPATPVVGARKLTTRRL